MKPSKAFSLNEVDWKKWAYDCFIFSVPALIVLVSQVQTAIPDMKLPVWAIPVAQFALSQLVALLKKYLSGPTV